MALLFQLTSSSTLLLTYGSRNLPRFVVELQCCDVCVERIWVSILFNQSRRIGDHSIPAHTPLHTTLHIPDLVAIAEARSKWGVQTIPTKTCS